MEFRLNKIDTELRKQVNDAAKEGKVHSKKSVYIAKDKKGRKSSYSQSSNDSTKKYSNKRLLVDANKTETVDVDGYIDEENENISKGIIIDVRK